MLSIYLSMLDTPQEKEKMTEIYEKHRYALLAYAMKILKNQDLAEDAIHTTFVAIIEQKEKYFYLEEDILRFKALSIVKNKSVDILRKLKPNDVLPIEEFELYLESEEKPVEEQVIFTSEYEAILKRLESIDEVSRQVLIMKYYHGMSYKEISDELGMTTKHIETKIARAKEKVRKLIKKEGEDFDG